MRPKDARPPTIRAGTASTPRTLRGLHAACARYARHHVFPMSLPVTHAWGWQGGYQSDGQFCLDCPEGKTCSRQGDVACEGVCGPGIQSQCDKTLMFAKCDNGACLVPTSTTQTVLRGTYENPLDGDCATYVQCKVGYYKRFTPTGSTPQCLPCSTVDTVGKIFVSSGLSPNDVYSCLWECDQRKLLVETLYWGNGWQCIMKTYDALTPAIHITGWRGIPGSKTYPLGTCNAGFTSEANTALTAGGCIACPAPPANAIPLSAGRNCEWGCVNGWYQRGSRCVTMWSEGWLCRDEGTTMTTGGECVTSSLPWNRGGTHKTHPQVSMRQRTVLINQEMSIQPRLMIRAAVGGVGGRHTISLDNQTAVVEGPLCSTTRSWVGGYEYLIGTVCDQSFLIHLNLSDSSKRWRLGVLIGQPDTPGWADGFKSQAKFGRELHVTSGASNGTVWVLDRWNCVVREVSIWTTPGDYRTRVYTVHGSTDKLMGMAIPQPRCYGPDSLASPRRFWELAGGSKVLFTDDNGLWQLELGTGALSLAMQETVGSDGTQFEADDLRTVTAPDRFTLLLEFLDGKVWEVTANSVACPDDSTSNAGGDCVVQCDWLEGGGSYVNGSSCTPCTVNGACGVGQEFVACTRSAQGRCGDCAAPAISDGRVYAVRGNCEASRMKYTPPCPVGHYAQGAFCEPCPSELSTTTYPNATRVQQCKCKPGLRRSKDSGLCVGQALYAYDGVCAVGCAPPPHATLGGAEWQLRRCLWECNTGFYHDTEASWLGKCKECDRMTADTGGAVTNGEDDSPLSCEFARI
jgi:hypothetical protein